MLLQRLREKACCIEHNGIILSEKGRISRKEIMFPQVATEPGGSHGPQTRLCTIYRTRDAPLVSIMVQHPAIHTIHVASSLLALLVYFSNQFEQRLVQFCQVSNLRGPVVHFKIDVRRVFRVPRGKHLVIPYSLKVGRVYVIRLTAANQQISSELEIGGNEVVIRTLGRIRGNSGKTLDTFVHGDIGVKVWAQVKRDTIVVVLIGLGV